MGFRRATSCDDALVAVELVTEKAIEFNVHVWLVSIHLSKAFDRVEHETLFEALADQGLPDSYASVLKRLYAEQVGVVDEEADFHVSRGVRQEDVLSPLLFNCALESVMRKWKEKLRDHGWDVLSRTQTQRLTNVRYADDLMLFAKSLDEAVDMVNLLQEELRKAGLDMNAKKTKVMTTDSEHYLREHPYLIEADGGFLEIAQQGETHKYLGRVLTGNPRQRGRGNLLHRISVAWMKFNIHRQTLLNKKIPVDLRLKMFNAIVPPAALYSLSSTPLTTACLEKLHATQRKMLRSIVGWPRESS